MQIIIPMSGFGERFRRAGYRIPKPLIELEGKPVIAHVIDMFPGETDFIFICNEEHLQDTSFRMREILTDLCPTGRIVSIPAHKHGPVHAVLLAAQHIDVSKQTVVNYCDFTCYWNWEHFKTWVTELQCKGAVPAYRGFHPHTLGTTNYAYIREEHDWMMDIQEKQPYTKNRMQEYASSGTYYFASGQLMLDAFRDTIKQNLKVGGEYYVSLAYKYLLAHDLPVAIYNLQHFMQWGTPEDVTEYKKWSDIFRHLCQPSATTAIGGTAIIPMAGLGKRFADEHYAVTKPLIPVSGKPMVLQAVHDLPATQQYDFVVREDMPDADHVINAILQTYPDANITKIAEVTEGQACTALIGLNDLADKIGEANIKGPILIGACDNGALYHGRHLNELLADGKVDVIVFGVRGHPNAARNPYMYGWIDCSGDNIKHISVKTPLSAPEKDPIVLGTFIFKRADDLRRSIAHMIDHHAKINGEYYLDTCINDAIKLGLHCKLFEVDYYLSWGTPNDLRTFEYWQSCFHKWASHPYRLELDTRIPANEREQLAQRYRATVPALIEAEEVA